MLSELGGMSRSKEGVWKEWRKTIWPWERASESWKHPLDRNEVVLLIG